MAERRRHNLIKSKMEKEIAHPVDSKSFARMGNGNHANKLNHA
jgi:hypothetical protein